MAYLLRDVQRCHGQADDVHAIPPCDELFIIWMDNMFLWSLFRLAIQFMELGFDAGSSNIYFALACCAAASEVRG